MQTFGKNGLINKNGLKRFFLPKKNRQVFFIKDWFKFKSTSMWDVFPNEIDFWDGGKNNNLAGDLPF
jgi:hypothetical protein